ncbi:MAG: FtsX-like permease family protein, partial [Candidatus Hodarchaeota archaeon]
MSKLSSFIHRGGLIVQFSRINLKLTVLTLVGLIIGLSMVGAALIQIDSTRAEYYISTFEEFQDEISLHISSHGSMSSYTSNSKDDIQSSVMSLLAENNMETFYQLVEHYPYSEIRGVSYGDQSTYGNSFYGAILGLENLDLILDNCVENSSLPNNLDEVILFVKNTTAIPVSLNEQFNVSSYIYGRNTYHNFTFTAVGLITPASLTNNSFLASFFSDYSYTDFYLINSFDDSVNLGLSMDEDLKTLYNAEDTFFCQFEYKYSFNLSMVPRDRILTLSTDFYNLQFEFWNLHGNSEPFVSVSIDFYEIYGRLANFEGLSLLFMFLSLPIFLIAALLVSFSLSLINEKRQKSLSLLKSRGSSDRFVFIIMFIETCFIALSASILAFIIGIPISLFLGSSSGLLTFNRPIDPLKLVFTPGTIQTVFLLSGIFTFLLYMPSLIRLSRSEALSLSEMSPKRSRRRLRVIMGKLDLIFLTLGSAGVILALVLTEFLRTNEQGAIVFGVLYPFLSLIMLFSPLMFFLGFIFFFSKFIPLIIKKLGKFAWNRDWRFVAIATRNLNISEGTTGRVIVLIAISLALMIAFTILAPSLHLQAKDNTYYSFGAEISYSMRSWSGPIFDQLVADLENVTGFSFTTIKEFEDSVFGPGFTYQNIRFMGIEENFADFAHWQTYYDDQPLDALVDSIYSSSNNNSAIIDSKTFTNEKLAIGDSYTVKADFKDIPISIQAATNYWPRMVSYSLSTFVITKSAFIENLTTSDQGYYDSYNTILGKILPGHDRKQVISEVKTTIEKWDPNPYGGYANYQFSIVDEVDM